MNCGAGQPGRVIGGGALTLALCVVGTSEAGSFDGLWRAGPDAECLYTGDNGGALKIEDDVLYGVALECSMTLPVNVRDMDALLFDMACEGEDLQWTDRAMFMHAADGGLFLIWNGYAYKYDACDETATDEVATSGAAGSDE